MFLACMFASAVYFLVQVIRYGPVYRREAGACPRWRRWLFFGVWGKGETAGLLVVLLALAGAHRATVHGILSLAVMADAPPAATCGNFGHPAGAAFWSRLQGTPEGDFLYALHLHRVGAEAAAAGIYARLSLARARVNLGVIRHRQGARAEATDLFREALAREPSLAEAAYNLGEENLRERSAGTESQVAPDLAPPVERAVLSGRPGLLLAHPDPGIWTRALEGAARAGERSAPVGFPGRFGTATSLPLLVFVAVLLLLGVASLLLPGPGPEPRTSSRASRVAWGLGFLVPGVARHWGLLGAPLLAACCFSALADWALHVTGGTSAGLLEALLAPAGAGFFGEEAAAAAVSSLSPLSRGAADLWWVALLVNPAAVYLLERVRPDPMGPRGTGSGAADAGRKG